MQVIYKKTKTEWEVIKKSVFLFYEIKHTWYINFPSLINKSLMIHKRKMMYKNALRLSINQ